MTKEHRASTRLNTSTLVHMTATGKKWVGTVKDVSVGGFLCARYGSADVDVQAGERYEATFVLPNGVVAAVVNVSWIRDEGSNIGLEFSEIGQEAAAVVSEYCDSPW